MRIVPASGRKRKSVAWRPWGPQAAGVLILVLSLLVVYHGTAGNRMLRLLDGEISGRVTKPVQTTWDHASDPAAVLSGGLAAVQKDIQNQAWAKAGEDLQSVETAWMQAQDRYAKQGVSPVDLNGLTGDLAELQMAVAARDTQDALTQVANAQKTFTYMAAVAATGVSPSLDQMAALVQDLSQALDQSDLRRAKADAKSLSAMLAHIEQGF